MLKVMESSYYIDLMGLFLCNSPAICPRLLRTERLSRTKGVIDYELLPIPLYFSKISVLIRHGKYRSTLKQNHIFLHNVLFLRFVD